MRDHRHVQFHPLGHVALGGLAVIDIELQPEPVAPDRLDDRGPLRLGVEEVAGHVAVVDRLDRQPHSAGQRLLSGPGQVRGIQAGGGDQRHAGRHDAGHAMHQLAIQRRGIVQCLLHALTEFRLPAGQACQAPLAIGPVARRHVEQRLGQAVRLQPGGDLGGGKIVGKQELDSLETRLARGFEPVEERQFVEHHRQIGSETRHGDPPGWLARKLQSAGLVYQTGDWTGCLPDWRLTGGAFAALRSTHCLLVSP